MKPKIKGYLGELKISIFLYFLNKKEYKVIHNINVFHNGMMSQIDHVIISIYGIFIIETKNYKGWIFGSERASEWTQVIYKNKYKLYNPVRQNLGHVRALKAHLTPYANLDFYPIVVFTGGAKLKVSSSFPVVKTWNLLKTIKNTREVNITSETMDEIYNLLLRINGNKPNIIPKKVESESFAEQQNLCAICNSPMVLREGKYSKFWGCSTYPSCNYTRRCK